MRRNISRCRRALTNYSENHLPVRITFSFLWASKLIKIIVPRKDAMSRAILGMGLNKTKTSMNKKLLLLEIVTFREMKNYTQVCAVTHEFT